MKASPPLKKAGVGILKEGCSRAKGNLNDVFSIGFSMSVSSPQMCVWGIRNKLVQMKKKEASETRQQRAVVIWFKMITQWRSMLPENLFHCRSFSLTCSFK